MGAPGTTKGPWQVSKSASRRVTSQSGIIICNAVLRNQGGPKAKSCLKDEHEAEANALQLAASSAIYDALAAIRSEFAQQHPLIVAGRDALAAARGAS